MTTSVRTLLFVFSAAVLCAALTSCKRSNDDFDNRTLEKRPHVESVKPESRADPFRP